jgi:WD40 repeat protein
MGNLAITTRVLGLFVTLSWLALQCLTPKISTAGEPLDRIQYAPWELVTALAWSPDGQILAVSAGTTIHLYDVLLKSNFYSNDLGVYSHSLVFSPGGEWLAAGSRDGRIRLWQVIKENEGFAINTAPERMIEAHAKGVNTLSFNQNGEWLVSGGNDAMARVWEVSTGALLSEIIGGTFTVPAVTFFGKPDKLAVVNGKDIRLRDPISRSITGSFQSGQALFSLAISPDSQLLAAGDTENGVQIWAIQQAFRSGMERYPEPVLKTDHNGREKTYQTLVWDVVFSPDGQILASAGGDGKVNLWAVTDGQRVNSFEGHQAGVTCLGFSPDGNWLATGSLDASVRFWRVK